jgi:lysophospholipid acyltransferase (LPLAT)-like uncharacterized protein
MNGDVATVRSGERLLGWAGAMVLGALERSWRSEMVGVEQLDALLGQGQKVLVAFWHGGYLPLFPLLKGRGGCVFASRSRRGRILCDICRRFGQNCLTIPEHGGEQTLAFMRTALAGRNLAGLAADGPLGPNRLVKRGVCLLAADLRMALLPAAFAAHPCLVLKGRWDRMAVPLPFARVCLVLGSPLRIPAELAGEPIETWTDRLHDALEAAGDLALRQLAR